MSLARLWSALTIPVKLPVPVFCQEAPYKKQGMLVHSGKLFWQQSIVILGMVWIMMCTYSSIISQTPSCVNLYSHLQTSLGFICSTAIYVWLSLKFTLQKCERLKFCPNWYNSKEDYPVTRGSHIIFSRETAHRSLYMQLCMDSPRTKSRTISQHAFCFNIFMLTC